MTPAYARQMYRRQFVQHGSTISLRRYGSDGTVSTEVEVLARVFDANPMELVSGISQAVSRAYVLAEDVENEDWPLPIVENDKVVIDGRERNINKADPNTSRIGDTVVAYLLEIEG